MITTVEPSFANLLRVPYGAYTALRAIRDYTRFTAQTFVEPSDPWLWTAYTQALPTVPLSLAELDTFVYTGGAL